MTKLINTSYDNQQFYEWDGLAEKWIVGENVFDTDFPPQPFTSETSLAAHIIRDVFGLTLASSDEEIGSDLPGYDVFNRGAYEIVQLSLVGELVNDKLYECYADGEGVVRFYEVGIASPLNEVIYSFSQRTLTPICENVIVFGYDPPEKRLIRGPSGGATDGYDIFTLSNSVDQYYLGPEFIDTDLGTYPKYWVTGDYLKYDLCPNDNYKEGYIEYSNVALEHQKFLDEQGIYKYKEFESIDGYAYKIRVPFFEQGSTRVEFRQKSLRYNELEGFGKLQVRKWESNQKYRPQACMEGEAVTDPEVGVTLPRSNEQKFAGVNAVYIIGYAVKQIDVDEIPDFKALTFSSGPADFQVDLDTMQSEPFKLSEGEDYLVVKEAEGTDYYRIVFSCNVSPIYAVKFGQRLGVDSPCTFRVAITSIYDLVGEDGEVLATPKCGTNKFAMLDECTGYLRDGVTVNGTISSNDILREVIFPTGDGTTGYVVKKIIVVYEWDNPCVAVLDQKNQVTDENLRDVSMEMFPIIIKNPPQYVAHNGTPLDPSEQLPDLDATTVEDLYAETYQRVMDSMENGDIRLTLPFLDQEGCNNVSKKILELQNHLADTTTYVCGPNSTPFLGQEIDGKIINSIDYSYQDGSQYLISVQAGPVWQGMNNWENSIYMNGTERLQLEGIVRFVYDDNMKCVVQLEQIGLMECVNGQQQPIFPGDMVKVTVYNNPVRR